MSLIEMARIKQLIIVGGPSGVGKSTLLKKLKAHDSVLSEQLAIEQAAPTLFLDAWQLHNINLPVDVEQLVIHYDFIYQYSVDCGYPHLTNLINSASSIKVLTLCAATELLQERVHNRLKTEIMLFLRKPTKRSLKWIRYNWKTKKLYKNYVRINENYNRWFEFIQTHGIIENLILETSHFDEKLMHRYQPEKVKMILESRR